MKTLLLVAFLFIAAPAAAAQTKSSSWINGVWTGTGYQIDDQSTWEMKFTARRGRYSIEYPSLGCGGRWRLVSINSTRARFREVLDHGQENCANRGRVTVQRLSRKQLLFLYAYEDTREISASAVLTRGANRN